MEGLFLARAEGSAEQSEAGRVDALAALERFGLENFATGGDDDRLVGVPRYRAVYQLSRISAAETPAQAASELRALSDLAASGNPSAAYYIDQIRQSCGEISTLVRDLETASTSESALERLRNGLPDAAEQMDNLRTEAIIRDIIRNPSPQLDQLTRVRDALAEEAEQCNNSAAQWAQWAEAQMRLARLSNNGGGPATETDRREAVSELARLAADGNDDARQALFAILYSGTRGDSGLGAGDRRPNIPDLGHLSDTERNALARQTLDAIDNLLTNGHVLSAAEARSLALIMGRAAAAGNTAIFDRAKEVIESAYRNYDQRTAIMDGLFDALAQQPPAAGRHDIADLLLSHADHGSFPEQFRRIINWAGHRDDVGLYIVAGVLSRPETRADVINLASSVARELGASPDRGLFVQQMIDRHRRAGDERALLSTLGEIAGNPAHNLPIALVNAARTEIRAGFDRSTDSAGTPSTERRNTYASAVAGLMSMSRHWERADADRVVRRATPEIAASMPLAVANIPEALRRPVIDGFFNRIRNSTQTSGEWAPAFTAIGNLARHLTADDLRAITDFQSANRTNINPDTEIAIGRALIQVVQNGSTAELRAAAVEHFADCGWSRRVGAETSRALADFARGENVSPEMLGRISELIYDLGVRPPISHVVRMLGYEVPPEHLEAAIARAGGEEQFRRMLEQMVTYNSLPRAVQQLIRTNSQDISGINPSALLPTAGNAPQLVTARQLIDHLRAGPLPDELSFLNGSTVGDRLRALEDRMLAQIAERAGVRPDEVRQRLSAMRLQALTGSQTDMPDREARTVRDARTATMSDLTEMTRRGHETSLWWNALTPAAYFIRRASNVSDFERRQGDLVRTLQSQDGELAALAGSFRRMQAVMQSVDLARDCQRLFSMSASGDRFGGDAQLLRMFNEHGASMLQTFAPDINRSLLGIGASSWQGGTWARLHRYGHTDVAVPPSYTYGSPHVIQQAAALLTSRDLSSVPVDSSSSPDRREVDLRFGARQFLIHEVLRAIDTHPDVGQVTQAAAALTQNYEEFSRLVQAGIQGHRGPELVSHVRALVRRTEGTPPQLVGGMEFQIQQIQRSLPQMQEVITQLRQARSQCTDSTARDGLTRRIEAMEGMVRMFSPGSPQMREFRRMCELVNSGSFDESTIWRTLRDNAVPIALCIAAAAAIVATCGAATPLAALGVAAAIAGTGLVIREGWAELSYQLNWTGTGGSQLGDALRGPGFLVYDVRSGRFAVPPGVLETLGNYGIMVGAETLMNLGLMGFGHVVGRGLSWVTGIGDATQRQAAAQTLNSLLQGAGRNAAALEAQVAAQAINQTQRTFWRTFGGQLLEQSGFALATHATEDSIRHGFNANNFFTQLSAAMLVVAAHRGVVHVQHYGFNGLRPRWMRPNLLEVPTDRAAFIQELNARIRAAGPDAPRVEMTERPNGNLRVTLDGRTIELTFIAPEAALARLRGGERPAETRTPVERVTPVERPPSTTAATEAPRHNPATDLPAGTIAEPMHPAAANGGNSTLRYDQAVPVVVREPSTTGGLDNFSRGFAVATPEGGAQVIRFAENPVDLAFSPARPFTAGENHLLISRHADASYFFDRTSGQVLRVTGSPGALTARAIDATVTRLDAAGLGRLQPAVTQEHSLALTLGTQRIDVAASSGRAMTIGSSARSDIHVGGDGNRLNATVFTDGNGFFVRASGPNVEVVHANGTRTAVRPNEAIALRAGDRLSVEGQVINLTPGTSQRFAGLPLRNTATDHRTSTPVDVARTPVVGEMPPGFSYCENIPGVNVPTRIVNPAIDPVLAAFEQGAVARFGHLRDNPQALMQALTRYVHDQMTPRTVQTGVGGDPRLTQGGGINRVADTVDASTGGRPLLIGELIARRNGVCLDQAMVLNYLARRMGLTTEVVTGQWNGQPHAWCRLRTSGDRNLVFDPRNVNLLRHSERAGMPEQTVRTEYRPFGADNPRPVGTGGRAFSGPQEQAAIASMRNAADLQAVVARGQAVPEAMWARPEVRNALIEAVRAKAENTNNPLGPGIVELFNRARPQDLPSLLLYTEMLLSSNTSPQVAAMFRPRVAEVALNTPPERIPDLMANMVALLEGGAGTTVGCQSTLRHWAAIMEGCPAAEFHTRLQHLSDLVNHMNTGPTAALLNQHPILRNLSVESCRSMLGQPREQVHQILESASNLCHAGASNMGSFRTLTDTVALMPPEMLSNPVVVEALARTIEQHQSPSVRRSRLDDYNRQREDFMQTLRRRLASIPEPTRGPIIERALEAFRTNRAAADRHPTIGHDLLSGPDAGPRIAEFLRNCERYPEFNARNADFQHELTTANGNHLFSFRDANGNRCYLVLQPRQTGGRFADTSLADSFRVVDLATGDPAFSGNRNGFLTRIADMEHSTLAQAGAGTRFTRGSFESRTGGAEIGANPHRVIAGDERTAAATDVPFYGASMQGAGTNGSARQLVSVGLDSAGRPVVVVLARYSDHAHEATAYPTARGRVPSITGLRISTTFD